MNETQAGDTVLDAEKTYMTLRKLLAGTAVALPLALVGGGWGLADLHVLPQLSAYYFTSVGDLFVGMLCVIGIGLIAYKGFTDAEDIALNIGGVLICLVALFHMEPKLALQCFVKADIDPSEYLLRSLQFRVPSWLHFACAVMFYVVLGYVMIFCSHASLVLQSSAKAVRLYRRLYTSLGTGFVVSVVLSFAIYKLMPDEGCGNLWILVAEVLGLLCFAAFWMVKTHEISRSGADKKRAHINRKMAAPNVRSLW